MREEAPADNVVDDRDGAAMQTVGFRQEAPCCQAGIGDILPAIARADRGKPQPSSPETTPRGTKICDGARRERMTRDGYYNVAESWDCNETGSCMQWFSSCI
jgi:hypothetical protein